MANFQDCHSCEVLEDRVRTEKAKRSAAGLDLRLSGRVCKCIVDEVGEFWIAGS